MSTPSAIQARLEYLRGQIKAERISYGEIFELEGLAEYIAPGDTLLLQWAGVPEFPKCPGHGDDEDCEDDPFDPCESCRNYYER